MKKHPFLQVDFDSAVKLTPKELKSIKTFLGLASIAMEELFKKKVIKLKAPRGFSLSVSLLICGESRIKQLNSEFRQKEKVTDVLSFPNYENLRVGQESISEKLIFLGDIAICHQVTKKQAKKFKITYQDEFIHLFMHGLLHLMGFDHEISEDEEKVMEEWERKALKIISDKKKGS